MLPKTTYLYQITNRVFHRTRANFFFFLFSKKQKTPTSQQHNYLECRQILSLFPFPLGQSLVYAFFFFLNQYLQPTTSGGCWLSVHSLHSFPFLFTNRTSACSEKQYVQLSQITLHLDSCLALSRLMKYKPNQKSQSGNLRKLLMKQTLMVCYVLLSAENALPCLESE